MEIAFLWARKMSLTRRSKLRQQTVFGHRMCNLLIFHSYVSSSLSANKNGRWKSDPKLLSTSISDRLQVWQCCVSGVKCCRVIPGVKLSQLPNKFILRRLGEWKIGANGRKQASQFASHALDHFPCYVTMIVRNSRHQVVHCSAWYF